MISDNKTSLYFECWIALQSSVNVTALNACARGSVHETVFAFYQLDVVSQGWECVCMCVCVCVCVCVCACVRVSAESGAPQPLSCPCPQVLVWGHGWLQWESNYPLWQWSCNHERERERERERVRKTSFDIDTQCSARGRCGDQALANSHGNKEMFESSHDVRYNWGSRTHVMNMMSSPCSANKMCLNLSSICRAVSITLFVCLPISVCLAVCMSMFCLI